MSSSVSQKRTPPQPFDPVEGVRTTTVLSIRNDRYINQYIRGAQVGSTAQTQVLLARDEKGREIVIKAVKRCNPTRDKFQLLRRNKALVNGQKIPLSTEQSIRKEIAIMKTCRHPHHVRLLEVIDDPRNDKVYLAMEYLRGGRVQWQTEENKRPLLTVEQTQRIFRDVLVGLEYLHYHGIVHRDIKPDNLIWSEDRSTIRIIDYGISHFSPALRRVPFARWRKRLESLKDPSLFPPADLTKLRGTEYFIAPEVVGVYDYPSPSVSSDTLGSTANSQASGSVPPTPPIPPPPPVERPPITQAIDIWSLAITLYCFLFGHFPFDVARNIDQHPNHAQFRLYQEICTKDWTVDDTMGRDCIPTGGRHPTDRASVIRLLDRMLQKDPKNRITMYEMKRHPWVLAGLADPDQWLRHTSPATAYTPYPFRWLQDVGRRLVSSLCKQPPTQRPQNSPSMT